MATQPAGSAVLPSDSAAIRPEAVLDVVRSLYTELHHAQPGTEHINLDSTLECDLGFDSLARVELLLRVEQRFGVHLPDATLGSLETVADLLRALTSPAGATAPAGRARLSTPAAEHTVPRRPPLGAPTRSATLNEVLEWHVQLHPDATHAVVLGDDQPESLTYAQLRDGARIVAGGLLRAGVEPESTVALMLPTSVGYFHAFLGVLLAGAIPVPIYPPTRPSQLEEHVHRHAGLLTNAGVDALVTFQEARTVARLLRTKVPSLRHVMSIGELAQSERFWTSRHAPSADSIAMLQYTSGSTGAPKGVILRHGNLLANIRAMGKVVGASDSDVFVSWLPLYHDMGLIGAWLGSLYFGFLLVIMSPTSFLARPERWLRAIHDYRGTLSASPNFGYELCAGRLGDQDLQGLDLSSWRVAFNGAEPVFPDTLERFQQRFSPYGFRPEAMTPVYGLAEAAAGLTFPPPGRGPITDCIDRVGMMRAGIAVRASAGDAKALRFVSCGRPLPGYHVRIVDAAGLEVPERVEGRLQFTGPSATAGYYHNAKATARLSDGEWLDTDDRAYLADGEVYITGRVKDIIIRRGRHIYPGEIESAVGQLEGVRKGCVAAFGSKDPATGTEKLVVLAETRYTDRKLRTQLAARINERVVDCIGEPPEEVVLAPPHTVLKTSSGKLRRAATRSAYEAGSLWRAPASPAMQLLRLGVESIRPTLRYWRQAAARAAYGLYAWGVTLAFALPVWLLTVLSRDRERTWHLTHRAAKWLVRAWGIVFSKSWETDMYWSVPHVIVVNHCSYLDSVFIAALLPRWHSFVAKTELQRLPWLGLYLRTLGTSFIERFAPRERVAEVERLRSELARGNSLVIYPEGTFTRLTGLGAFRLGAFQAAVAAGAPVIPIALKGTRSVLRHGQWLPRRVPVSAVVGRPIAEPASDNAFAAAVRVRDAARAHILRHCGEPDLL